MLKDLRCNATADLSRLAFFLQSSRSASVSTLGSPGTLTGLQTCVHACMLSRVQLFVTSGFDPWSGN